MKVFENALTDLDFPLIQNWLKENCQSDGAKNLCNQFTNYNQQKVSLELDLTQEIIDSINRNDPYLNLKIPIIKTWFELLKIKGNKLNNTQFNELNTILEISYNLKKLCIKNNFPKWNKKLIDLFLFKEGQNKIFKIFNEKFEIKNTASNELNQIRTN